MMRALAALLLVLSPIAALAEDEAPPPRWSLGAGISTTVIRLTDFGGGFIGYSAGPAAVASLERRLSGSSWLVLGVDGTLADSEEELLGGSGTARSEYRRLALDLGLRHVLTRRGAVVDVSVVALAVGGYEEQHRTGWSTPDQDNSSWSVGGNVGLALDRELTQGLSLRVATPVAGVSWQQRRAELSGETVHGHWLTAGVYLAPRLELRLAF